LETIFWNKGGNVKKETISLEKIEQFILDAGSDSLEVFGGTYEGGIHIQQVPDELAQCIKAIFDTGISITALLEIGVAAGGTTYVLNHFFNPEKIVLIDDNRHPKAPLRPFVLAGLNRREIVGNSHDLTVVGQVEGPFDLIIIDGDHSYTGCMTDVNAYLPFLNSGGVVVLHDTQQTQWGCEVPLVMEKLRHDPRVKFIGEYISTKRMPCGLALFQKVVS
jgi:predicted O-methyltransferase YrrM